MEAQTLTSQTPSGKIGVWWFLASEIPVFGGLIVSYVVLRLGGAGWVFFLSMIILMPTVIPWVKRRLSA